MRRVLVAFAVVVGILVPTAGMAGAAVGSVPPVVDEASIRAAKAGLSWFLLENVDRPRNVTDPCPLLSLASVGDYLGRLGLTASARTYGVEVVFDANVGGGVVAVRCGVDVAASADPQGSTAMALDALMLDGQATFAQFAVRIFGRDVVVSDVTDPAVGELAGKCSNGGQSCTVAANFDGLVLVVRLSGLPADTGVSLARQLVVTVAPETMANLAAVPAPA